MKNSVSDRSLFIESEEDVEEHEYSKGNDEDVYDSDSSNYSNDDQQQSRPNSVNTTTWPQSYR